MANTVSNLAPGGSGSDVEHPATTSGGSALDAALPLIQGLTQLHDSVAVLDPDGRVVWLSDSLASTCGGARSLKGRDWLESLAEPVGESDLRRRLREFGRLSNEPILLRSAEGARPARVSATRLGARGDCRAVVAIFRHDGGSNRASEITHSLEYLSAILDSAPEGVVVVDRSRFITYANPAMERMTGYPIERLVDKPLALFIRPGADFERIAQTLRPGASPCSEDLDVQRRDGTPLRVNVSAKLLTLPDGTAAGAVAYVRDVTERRRVEEALERKNAELEHYVHAVSHDLRSPLVAILGFARLLREDFADELGDKGQHFLRRIEEAGRTMESLVQDLLELSRIGQTPTSRERVDPRPVLQQLHAEMKPRLEAAGVALRVPDDPPVVRCDRTHLYRLFGNLIENALQHMGRGEGATIEVSFAPHEDGARLCVADNGRGIPAEEQGRIFEIFHSGSESGGTGIGLAVVKKIAEAHGGRAWVESVPGDGARFYATLPV